MTVFFADARLLWLLAPLVMIWIVVWWRRMRTPKHATVIYSSIAAIDHVRPSRRQRVRRWVQALRVITVALVMLALARPQSNRDDTPVRTEGIDIMLAIDTSGSMRALDLDTQRSIAERHNRLQVAKDVVEKFINKRVNDQIGMVVFGEEAFTQCPLTLDHTILNTFLDALEIGMAGDSTAIGSAVGTAVKRLKDSKAKSKVVILLTDGRNNAGTLSPKKSAEVAQAMGVKIYTIAAGTRDKAPFIVETPFGPTVQYEDVQIDEETLQDMANVTGGAYFRAEDTQALQSIYDKIDTLEKTDMEVKAYHDYEERFAWFVIPALVLLILEIILLGTWLRQIP